MERSDLKVTELSKYYGDHVMVDGISLPLKDAIDVVLALKEGVREEDLLQLATAESTFSQTDIIGALGSVCTHMLCCRNHGLCTCKK